MTLVSRTATSPFGIPESQLGIPEFNLIASWSAVVEFGLPKCTLEARSLFASLVALWFSLVVEYLSVSLILR